jgi:enoyl-CoA hydratase/carnithine racemase
MLLVGFDYRGKSVNVLNIESMSEWQHIVQAAERSTAITGVLLMNNSSTSPINSSTPWTGRPNRLSLQ